ncbi:TolC family outer membrane protein [Methylobacterium sp. NEAU K]|uniref:TolC family outer membrane protein n=1 Tax=Methylobacterium sp. NEAU K TaxID=3064946 RepID=UPI002737512B|nr:TolC family outer membrane protein [Methylobacterium sp. NEAU K]MDP4003126.1 TolC family outer membrane protein [Methylobacterium sp. NEAU K]
MIPAVVQSSEATYGVPYWRLPYKFLKNSVRSVRTMARKATITSRMVVLPLWICGGFSTAEARETLNGSLLLAYRGNPDLNAQRANLRVVDENVAQALSGYRPKVNIGVNAGIAQSDGSLSGAQIQYRTIPMQAGLTVSQTIFDGFRTDNKTRMAESQVYSQRETLRGVESNVLFSAAVAYMNLLRDTAIYALQQNNVEVIQEQLRQTRIRLDEGQVTLTDISQAEARLAVAQAQLSTGESTLQTSIGSFRQIIGVDPHDLAPGRPIDQFIPPDRDSAIATAFRDHPGIIAARHDVDVAEAQVKVAEGQLYPQLTASASVEGNHDLPPLSSSPRPNSSSLSGIFQGRLTIPIYEGGLVYSDIRQAKERVGQRRIEVESIRDRVRFNVVTAWGVLEASKAAVVASQKAVIANERALAGVREEAAIGQRTTLDVLNAQQELLLARVGLVSAQRDRVVASYQVLFSMGQLTVKFLSLSDDLYDKKIHYDQVKDLWFGVRSPDGR